MAKPIYYCGGDKGGVGKSMMSMAAIDFFVERGERVVLVETDTANADVWKCYNKTAESLLIDLDIANGWAKLVDRLKDIPDSIVVINTPARSLKGVQKFGVVLDSSLAELKRDMVTLWVINAERDSLEALKAFMDSVKHTKIHVARNEKFGEYDEFELYNQSNIRGIVEERRGKSLMLPSLASRVATDLYSNRRSIAQAQRDMSIGNRAELTRWRNAVTHMMNDVVNA